MPTARLRSRAVLLALCLFGVTAGTTASATHAADSAELWPELNASLRLSPGTRLFLAASFAEGRESTSRSADFAAALDLSILPIARKSLRTQDWHRGRYLWARIGYTRVDKVAEKERELAEHRGTVALNGKLPLPAEVWLEGRARADLRWIGGVPSQRYRFRVEASREFEARKHAVAPYLHYEWFYDSRYDGWSRTLAEGGVEVAVSERFRYELYLARQTDRLPNDSTVDALGIVAKWYR